MHIFCYEPATTSLEDKDKSTINITEYEPSYATVHLEAGTREKQHGIHILSILLNKINSKKTIVLNDNGISKERVETYFKENRRNLLIKMNMKY